MCPEAIDSLGKAITVRSSGGAALTTIDGTGVFHVVQCVSGEGADTELDGFTITGGNANGATPNDRGGGMRNLGSSPTVTDCTFSGNMATFVRGRVKRRLLIIAIFLLLGAVVNAAVAWGLDTWTRARVEKVLRSRIVNPQPFVPPADELYIRIHFGRYAVGWPTDALGYTWAFDEFPPHYWSLRPIWPGFAINTLFYAAILWLLIPGPFVLRRFVRVRRGLCPACAYPMGESSVCSECGKALLSST